MKRIVWGVVAITIAVSVLTSAADASARRNRDRLASEMPRVSACSSQPTTRLCVSCCTALKRDGGGKWSNAQCQDHCRLPRMGTLVEPN